MFERKSQAIRRRRGRPRRSANLPLATRPGQGLPVTVELAITTSSLTGRTGLTSRMVR